MCFFTSFFSAEKEEEMVPNAGAVGSCELRHGLEEELKGSEDCQVGKENTKGVIPPKQSPPAIWQFGIWFCNNIFKILRLLIYFCVSLTLTITLKLKLGL
jgi:hypothetical protein